MSVKYRFFFSDLNSEIVRILKSYRLRISLFPELLSFRNGPIQDDGDSKLMDTFRIRMQIYILHRTPYSIRASITYRVPQELGLLRYEYEVKRVETASSEILRRQKLAISEK